MRNKTKVYRWILLLFCSYSFAQMDSYDYKRELNGISETWHKITIPNEIFGVVSNDLSDLRIYGITDNNDTIEAPYLLQLEKEKIVSETIKFNTINTSNTKNGYFFTFEIPSAKTINEINLDFGTKNFDWGIGLEGSQNNQEWFTILKDYRILAIKNSVTNYDFTKVVFPDSKYRYFRLFIPSKTNPNLISANLSQKKTTPGVFRNYSIHKMAIHENKEKKQTEIDLDLKLPVSVSEVQIAIEDNFDYYRPVTIQYLQDSTKTEQGYIYNYNNLSMGTLNSIEKNIFKCNPKIVQKLKINIRNDANEPLTIETIQVRGIEYAMHIRFTKPAKYYLTYGNNSAETPNYDIIKHTDKIPIELSEITLGVEQKINKTPAKITEPLFKNKIWLWGILTVVIILLGGFSLSMMRKK